MPAPLLILNAVGLTPRWLAHAPRLRALAEAGWLRRLREVLPAVTCTAQATLLTGQTPARHGIVGNGWLFRDTGEVRFWQQSNRLIQAEPLYATARRRAKERGRAFKSAKLFWWFNQGAAVDLSVTPKPHYAVDGNKAFGITGTPPEFAEGIEEHIGTFPFPAFWGPMAGLASTRWIAELAAHQLAHVYVQNPDDVPRVTDVLAPLPGVGRVLAGGERAELHLDHPRSGEVVLLAARDAWFAYPFWLDDRLAPDYARAVAIHHKPGFDPCELFFDPRLTLPKLRVIRRLVQKKLGFRMRMDVVPLDASVVRGSHGLAAADA